MTSPPPVTHLLATESPDREMVLRRYPPGDGAPRREATVLAALDGLDGCAPADARRSGGHPVR